MFPCRRAPQQAAGRITPAFLAKQNSSGFAGLGASLDLSRSRVFEAPIHLTGCP